jgi:hypothetical protein
VSDDLARGLEPGARFRCDGCGNVTRFDVVATVRTRRFHHFDLGGEGGSRRRRCSRPTSSP